MEMTTFMEHCNGILMDPEQFAFAIAGFLAVELFLSCRPLGQFQGPTWPLFILFTQPPSPKIKLERSWKASTPPFKSHQKRDNRRLWKRKDTLTGEKLEKISETVAAPVAPGSRQRAKKLQRDHVTHFVDVCFFYYSELIVIWLLFECYLLYQAIVVDATCSTFFKSHRQSHQGCGIWEDKEIGEFDKGL